MKVARMLLAAFIAVLPSPLKIFIYRHCFGYTIGNRVRIGASAFADVGVCVIGDDVTIGHFNLFVAVQELIVGDHVQIGFLNVFRGGKVIRIGSYATILRQNVMNSIIKPDGANSATPELILGDGAVITTRHWLDFTDKIELGSHTIMGGRNSSMWTHNRHRTRPITLGHHCYLGSESRIAPGMRLPDCCVVALGSVLLKSIAEPNCLIAGNPAQVVRPLTKHDLPLITRKTRADIPDDVAAELLSEELRQADQIPSQRAFSQP